jgi:hypothetical protein|tara:strand:- start:497 stop:1294 length:798 start_codon:yes stop_codon:yes gene_type:complete
MNTKLYSSLSLIIIIFSSILLQYRIIELFKQFNLDGENNKYKNDNIQTDILNHNYNRVENNEKKINKIKTFVPNSFKKLNDISSKDKNVIRVEKIFNNSSSFKYGELLFLSSYHWGGIILNGNNFTNKNRSSYKKFKIISTTGKKNEETIKYGDYIRVPGITNDILRIIGSTTGNSIFPGNYFYLQNSKKNWYNLSIGWCSSRWSGVKGCKINNCGNKHQWHWWWRRYKRRCELSSCECPIKHNSSDGIFRNRVRGGRERMKFIR